MYTVYTIGEVSKMVNLPIPTLRYYDNEGLLIDTVRDSAGIRKFNDKTLESLRVIECLKKSGLQIKEIKEFMNWCSLGDKTISQRREMFIRQKAHIEQEIKELEDALALIKFKCWYYDEALKEGSEKRVKKLDPHAMPAELRLLFEQSHQQYKKKPITK